MRFKEFLKEADPNNAIRSSQITRNLRILNDEVDDFLSEFTKLTNQIKANAKIRKSLTEIKKLNPKAGQTLQSMITGLTFPLKAKNVGIEARVKTLKGFQRTIK